MKCVVLVVGILAILAFARAEDDAVEEAQSEPESATLVDEEQLGDNGHPHPPRHHPHHHPRGHPADKPPKRIPVFKIGFDLDTGK